MRGRIFGPVVVIPWYRDFVDHIPVLSELPAWEEVTVVDLPSTLPSDAKDYFRDAKHPTVEGHRLIADGITEALRAAWRL